MIRIHSNEGGDHRDWDYCALPLAMRSAEASI